MAQDQLPAMPGELSGDCTEKRTPKPIDEEVDFSETDWRVFGHIDFIMGDFMERCPVFVEVVLKRWGYVQVPRLTWTGDTSEIKLAAIRLLEVTNNRHADAAEDLCAALRDEDEVVRAAAGELLDKWNS